ncbi:MAG: hypothetical protein ACI9LX_004221 [Paraglaciecola sp.]|jgi:hypothetical protein
MNLEVGIKVKSEQYPLLNWMVKHVRVFRQVN